MIFPEPRVHWNHWAGRVLFLCQLGVALHQFENVWDSGNVLWNACLVREQRGITVLLARMIAMHRADGTLAGSFGRVGHQLGEFYNLHFIGVDSKGNVYSAEVQGKRVQKFRNLGGL